MTEAQAKAIADNAVRSPSKAFLWTSYYNGDLHIKFKGGRGSDFYTFSGIPRSIVVGFRAASSMGLYYHKFIKNRFPYRRSKYQGFRALLPESINSLF